MFRTLAAALVCAPLCLSAQENFVLRNYTAAHGVPQSQINGMIEDANGYLWLATYGGGVARFDGQNFKVYTTLDGLLNNIVYDLKIDSEQNIWAVHPQGISRFNGTSFKTFRPVADSANRNTVRRALVFEDTVLVLSAPGLLGKIYKDSVYYWNKAYQPDAFINRIFQFASGELCMLMSDKRVFIKSRLGNTLIGSLPEDQVVYSGYRENDNLKLESYSPADHTMMVYEVNLKRGTLQASKKTSDHTVLFSNPARHERWMMDVHNNLIKVNTLTNEQQIILKDKGINYVMPDQEGNTWIGSNGGGLYKYYHQDFTRIGPENPVGVMSVLKDNDAIWAGSMNHGLWKFKNGKETYYANKQEVLCITKAPDGTLWAGGTTGIGKYNEGTDKFEWLSMKDGLAGDLVFSIQFDEKNNLWIATGGGLSYYDGKKFTNYKTEQGLLVNRVNAAYYSKRFKTLFMGNELGINTLSSGRMGELRFKEFENTTILSINPYRDSLLLIGSGGSGFAVYNPDKKTLRLITTHDGLASDFIYFIASDTDDVIWVGTEKGISRMVLDKELNIVENIHFDHENGLSGVETNQNAFSLQDDMKLFGLIDGVYRFNEAESKKSHPFDVHLTDVEVFYGEESSREYADSVTGSFRIPYHPSFPHNKNHITFAFNRVDKLNPKSVKFRYRLNPYDKGWSKPSTMRQVTYSNLPPGNYEFVVMATNHQGNWSEKELRYPFVIRAAFYQTATFWVFVFLLLAGAIALGFYLRMRQKIEQAMLREKIRLHEQEHLRKEIARDFHDEMGNQLTRIINYVSLLKLNGSVAGSTASRTDLYTKVENSAKYLYTGTRDFIWSIDPVNDELSKLFIHIRDFGEKLFEEKEIKFRAFNDVKINVKLPYGFSREANLIFKEAMTNTFKSAEAKNAAFSLFSRENGFEFVFEDDGVGFDLEEKKAFGGLKNIRDRAEKLRAVLTITSTPGKGTRISLKFQFEKKTNYVVTI
jgi:signal transduction histidine kinase/ligand-binding sensor domain-containing protein